MFKLEKLYLHTTVPLVVINIAPLLFNIFLGWSIEGLLFTYWIESIFILYFTVEKMKLAPLATTDSEEYKKLRIIFKHALDDIKSKTDLIIIFKYLFGIFLSAYGVVLLFYLLYNFDTDIFNYVPFATALFFFHYFSFKVNFFAKKEYERTTVHKLIFSMIKRITPLHFAVIAGGGAAMIITKTIADVFFHINEHPSVQDSKVGAKGLRETF